MEALQEIDRPLRILKADLKRAAATMTAHEARYLVDLYYQIQEFRKSANNQISAMEKDHEPMAIIDWVFGTTERIELEIKKALDIYTDKEPTGMGAWAKGVIGIGPIISAGLLAHIDISKVQTVGGIWRFAGMDPTIQWEKHQKRPWNARLKTLCWKIGESFVKVSGNPNSLYGKLYTERKAKEIEANDRGDYADQAKRVLEVKKIGKQTEAYKYYLQGMLPPAHIHARAKRWTVKIFLYHWFEQAYRQHHKKEPPEPYVIAILGHAHKIEAEIVD